MRSTFLCVARAESFSAAPMDHRERKTGHWIGFGGRGPFHPRRRMPERVQWLFWPGMGPDEGLEGEQTG